MPQTVTGTLTNGSSPVVGDGRRTVRVCVAQHADTDAADGDRNVHQAAASGRRRGAQFAASRQGLPPDAADRDRDSNQDSRTWRPAHTVRGGITQDARADAAHRHRDSNKTPGTRPTGSSTIRRGITKDARADPTHRHRNSNKTASASRPHRGTVRRGIPKDADTDAANIHRRRDDRVRLIHPGLFCRRGGTRTVAEHVDIDARHRDRGLDQGCVGRLDRSGGGTGFVARTVVEHASRRCRRRSPERRQLRCWHCRSEPSRAPDQLPHPGPQR